MLEQLKKYEKQRLVDRIKKIKATATVFQIIKRRERGNIKQHTEEKMQMDAPPLSEEELN